MSEAVVRLVPLDPPLLLPGAEIQVGEDLFLCAYNTGKFVGAASQESVFEEPPHPQLMDKRESVQLQANDGSPADSTVPKYLMFTKDKGLVYGKNELSKFPNLVTIRLMLSLPFKSG